MKTVTVYCDRCGEEIPGVVSNVMGKDLCGKCSQSFWKWFHKPKEEKEAKQGRVPGAMVSRTDEPDEAKGAMTISEWAGLVELKRSYVQTWILEHGVEPVSNYKRPFFNVSGRISRAKVYRLTDEQVAELKRRAERLGGEAAAE